MTVLVPTERITDAERDRALRACSVFERFSSAFNRSKVRVNLVPAMTSPAPAYSTAEDIYLTDEALADLKTVDGILSAKGLVLHENLHIKYTPRDGSRLVSTVIERDQFSTFNVLEDMRIETLAVGRYGRAVSRWLIPTVLKHIIEQGDITRAFPLIHGRRYLPLELRRAVRQAFIAQDKVARVGELIDQYRVLTFGGSHNIDEALAIIDEVHNLLGALPHPQGDGGKTTRPDGCGGVPIPASGSRPAPKSEQDKATANDKGEVDDLTNDESDDDAEPLDNDETGEDDTDDFEDDTDGDDLESDDDTDDESEDGDDLDGEDGEDYTDVNYGGRPDPTSDGQPTDGESDSTTDGDTNEASATNNDGAGGGYSDVPTDAIERAEDAIRDAIEQSLENVSDDVRNDGRAINGAEFDLEGGEEVNLKTRKASERAVSPSTILASNAFGRELEELRVKHEAGWNRRTKSGRLNIGRIAKGCELDEAFDKFQTGREDAVDIEAVILLDTSGSMSDMDVTASESMWAIKRALDSVNASSSVVTFDSVCEVLYDANERAGQTMRFAGARGSTSPTNALRYARNVLAQSSRKVKVLFTITDGSWSGAENDEIVDALRDGGVLTALVTLGYSSYGDHNHEMTAVVSQPSSLLGLARELVAVATERNLDA